MTSGIFDIIRNDHNNFPVNTYTQIIVSSAKIAFSRTRQRKRKCCIFLNVFYVPFTNWYVKSSHIVNSPISTCTLLDPSRVASSDSLELLTLWIDTCSYSYNVYTFSMLYENKTLVNPVVIKQVKPASHCKKMSYYTRVYFTHVYKEY